MSRPPDIESLGPWSPPTPAQQATLRALVAGEPDAEALLAAMGSGEWDE